uniref:Lipocalin/cytosolic fatty-acid binding domain-containing protein n=1 Tax=Amblyomma maculatum TaxID=34609 RepID=G3MS81_AMBMU
MRFFILTAVGLMSGALVFTQNQPHGEVRMDDANEYREYQDIYKAFNISKTFWLYGFSYHSPHTVNKSCVFFKIESLSKEGMNYSSNFIKNGQRGKIEYTGTFLKTLGRDLALDKERQHKNSLFATLRNGSWPMLYTLGFADYLGCAVFRVQNMTPGCMVLLSDDVARNNMSTNCTAFYKNACGKDPIRQVPCANRSESFELGL